MFNRGPNSPARYPDSSGFCNKFQSAKATTALLIIGDRLQQMEATKIGPQRIGHIDFSIGHLPQKKVRDSHLAAGSNQQIKLGQIAGIEFPSDGDFIEIID